MKKMFLLLAVAVASVTTASAQWGAGLRASRGIQAVVQYEMPSGNYWEARLGIDNNDKYGPAVSVLHMWNVKNWDWTPGNWFLDIGGGANTVISRNYLFLGAQAVGKFGYEFPGIPLALSADVSPVIGPNIGLKKGYATEFYGAGLWANWGISAVWSF